MITRPEVSEKACPVEVVEINVPNAPEDRRGNPQAAGKGPVPGLVHLHGGLETWPKAG